MTPDHSSFDPNAQWGAGLVGLVVATILYGITCVQTFTYYNRCGRDPLWLKLLVAILWVLDTAHSGTITHTVYFSVIIHFSQPQANIVWSQPVDVYLTSTVAWIVQSFLIFRIWSMSQGIIRYASVVTLFLVTSLGFTMGIAYASKVLQIKAIARIPETASLMNVALGCTVAGDILLTICMSFLLARSRTGLERTDTVIGTLIKYTVRNGLLTSTCAFLDVVMHIALPTTQAFLAFYCLLAKLYTNTFLATLNARDVLRNKAECTDRSSIKFDTDTEIRPSGRNFSEGTIEQSLRSQTVKGTESQHHIETKAQIEG
ncbi:hypothetical protein PILCRDRAFT_823420 [Piloderma croceum F 1598]|uniref:DUF6534 domain-containing protein n=1 Tax=Piloderma croceum (strain F 1598) TaxID=765440 RepID=A0A0C3F415_PILCF|nr:hypothetical protein PILCRDRAFT_823420 [Piloderma croceum F 1598]